MNSGVSLSSGSAGQSSLTPGPSPGGRGETLDQLVPPEVAAGGHGHGVARAAEHDALLDRRRLLQGQVDVLLQRQLLAAAPASVRGEDYLGRRIVVPLGDGLGGKAAEDDAVDRADPQASMAIASSGTNGI